MYIYIYIYIYILRAILIITILTMIIRRMIRQNTQRVMEKGGLHIFTKSNIVNSLMSRGSQAHHTIHLKREDSSPPTRTAPSSGSTTRSRARRRLLLPGRAQKGKWKRRGRLILTKLKCGSHAHLICLPLLIAAAGGSHDADALAGADFQGAGLQRLGDSKDTV